MIRKDWSAKPSHQVWRDLVYGEWWTRTESTTGDDGVCGIRAIKGAYRIEADLDGRIAKAEVNLGAGGAVVRLKLPAPQAPSEP
jgi:hypothetical protein